MTVIAWDGKTLASDSLMSDQYGSVVGPMKKLYRLKSGGMVGMSGDADARTVIHLLDNVKDEQDLPTKQELETLRTDGDYILVLPDKTVWLVSISYDGDGRYFGEIVPSRARFMAVGHGQDYARAAMSLGLTAEKAVKEACKFSLSCGGAVQTMKLEDRPKEKIKRVRKPNQSEAVVE